jgi:hypothetical protein
MKTEFTAIVEQDGEWYLAYSSEIPGPLGQDSICTEGLTGLNDAINMIVSDLSEDDNDLMGVAQPEDFQEEVERELHNLLHPGEGFLKLL